MTLNASLDTVLGLLPGCPEGLPGRAVENEAQACAAELELVLGWHHECLGLWRPQGKETPLMVSFCEGKQGYRLTPERVRHERLIKALGKPKEERIRVLDATAGLGVMRHLWRKRGFRYCWPNAHLYCTPCLQMACNGHLLAWQPTCNYSLARTAEPARLVTCTRCTWIPCFLPGKKARR